jgi:glycosyltransferase involved in cell wall biosynthesis
MASIQSTPAGPKRAAAPAPQVEVSVVIPCLNESANIEQCVRRSQAALDEAGILGEVVVADNDSDDGSA